MYGTNSLVHLTLFELGEILVYVGTVTIINSLINPIIYAVKIPMVRAKFKCCLRNGNNN